MIIAVSGNSGAGKSSLAIKIATMLANEKKNVVLVDTDFVTPQFNIWYPKEEIFNHTSLAVLLDNNVDVESVTGKLHVINDYLGVLGYGRNYSANAMPRRPDTASHLLICLNEIADYVVVDVQTGFINDILSFEVMSTADVRIVALTPDIKALSWYDSNIRMMEEAWRNTDANIIRVMNKVQPTDPVADVEKIVGEAKYYLPFSLEVEEQMSIGKMDDITPTHKTAKIYIQILKSLVQDIVARTPAKPQAPENATE